MALTTTNVWISSAVQAIAPTGHTVPLVAANIGVVDTEQKKDISFSILYTDFVNVTKETAFDALLNTAAKAAIVTELATMGIDTVGNTVQYNFKVLSINPTQTNNDFLLPDANRSVTVRGRLTIGIS